MRLWRAKRAGVRKARRGGDLVWKCALDLWFGSSAFVAREARLGVDWFWILPAFVECEVRRGVL